MYYLLTKDGVLYRTKNKWGVTLATQLLGYKKAGSRLIKYPPSSVAKLLPMKKEMDKYNVVKRLTK